MMTQWLERLDQIRLPTALRPVGEDRSGVAGSRPPLRVLKRIWRIEDVIQASGVALTRTGADRLVGHCPFHEDRTPSFTVYLSTQRFHCYGRCHRHGDVLDFVQQARGCSLAEAIQWIEEVWPNGRVPVASKWGGSGPPRSPLPPPAPDGIPSTDGVPLTPPDGTPPPGSRYLQGAIRLPKPRGVTHSNDVHPCQCQGALG